MKVKLAKANGEWQNKQDLKIIYQTAARTDVSVCSSKEKSDKQSYNGALATAKQ